MGVLSEASGGQKRGLSLFYFTIYNTQHIMGQPEKPVVSH